MSHHVNRAFIPPQIFTNYHPAVDVVDAQNQVAVTGQERAELVKHRIVREVVFGVGRLHCAVLEHADTVLGLLGMGGIKLVGRRRKGPVGVAH
ncbi:MAG: Uncharacterised protein [Cellulomonadaceae bacterium TMED98]|nr:MAG: Uncharacterised protein [Cellulomonadaceae bacterium TMED98]